MKRWGGVVPLLLAGAVCGQSTPKSLLWRITSDSSQRASYLLGTVHSKDDRAFRWGDSLLPALERVDLVAGELDLEESKKQMLAIMPLALMPKGQLLKDLYRKRDWKVVEAALKERMGFMAGMAERMKPFFVILILSGGNTDGDRERVLDEDLLYRAKQNGQQVIGLETMREQVIAMDVLSVEDQADLLLDFVRAGNAEEEMDRMLDAYADQDLDALMGIVANSPTMPSAMDASLIVERNGRMAHRMDSILTSGTCSFFAVGSAHLPRDSGLIALMRARGYRVEPVFSPYTKPKVPKLPPIDDKD